MLWDGNLNTDEFLPAWQAMILEWAGACAVGGLGNLFIYGLRHLPRLISLNLADVCYFVLVADIY